MKYQKAGTIEKADFYFEIPRFSFEMVKAMSFFCPLRIKILTFQLSPFFFGTSKIYAVYSKSQK